MGTQQSLSLAQRIIYESQYIKSVACTNMHNRSLINGKNAYACHNVCESDKFIVCHIHV